jgi:hypothetical protein
MFDLQPPRHISTLPKPKSVFNGRISAFASCGHACRIGLGRLVPHPDSCAAAIIRSLDHLIGGHEQRIRHR